MDIVAIVTKAIFPFSKKTAWLYVNEVIMRGNNNIFS